MADSNTKELVRSDRKTEVAKKEPPMYRVILHNDHYTSMDFVVTILEKVFHKSPTESTQVMLAVHHQGAGVAGIYTKEVAETKIVIVAQLARENGFPLKCSMEPV